MSNYFGLQLMLCEGCSLFFVLCSLFFFLFFARCSLFFVRFILCSFISPISPISPPHHLTYFIFFLVFDESSLRFDFHCVSISSSRHLATSPISPISPPHHLIISSFSYSRYSKWVLFPSSLTKVKFIRSIMRTDFSLAV